MYGTGELERVSDENFQREQAWTLATNYFVHQSIKTSTNYKELAENFHNNNNNNNNNSNEH